MNERIQQIIYSLNEKAGVQWINEDKRKFAELIVRECAEVCKKQSFHYAEHNNKGSAAGAADVCRILMYQHFGVKQ